MVSPIRRFSVLVPVILAGILVVSGCATKKYVREQVSGLEPSIKEARTMGEENRERIDAVDKRAQQGIADAKTAASAANVADQKATAAQKTADGAQTAAAAADRNAQQGIQTANKRIDTLDSRVASINDIYTQSDSQSVTFLNNSTNLSDQAKGTLDGIASSVTGQRSGYMIELQGYTDSRGSDQYNLGLSQRRAEAVQRYLVSKDVPLYRISIVGLGKDKPVADNKTRQGRDQNRRVEIRVLRSGGGRQTN